EQSEVELSAEESALPTRRGHGGELVGEDRLRIVEESADECRFAVVDGSGSGEAQQSLRRRVQRRRRLGGGCFGGGCRRHQKYPSFLRSSIAAAEIRSSARVAPRSVTVVAATSARIDSRSSALDSTAPVQLMSPTVRSRTFFVVTVSSSRGVENSPVAHHMPSRWKTSRSWAK